MLHNALLGVEEIILVSMDTQFLYIFDLPFFSAHAVTGIFNQIISFIVARNFLNEPKSFMYTFPYHSNRNLVMLSINDLFRWPTPERPYNAVFGSHADSAVLIGSNEITLKAE